MARAQERRKSSDDPLKPLELSTPLLLRELGDGATLAFPIADPSLVSIGDESHVLAELRIYLEAIGATAPPELLARLAAPSAGELLEVNVRLEREDLPRRLQLSEPVAIACLILPHGKDRWVLLPALDHTFYVPADAPLEPAVRAEVQRMVAARAPTPAEWLALLPPREQRLEALELAIDRADRLVPGRARAARKRVAERKRRQTATAILESVGSALHDDARFRDGPPLVGRKTELDQLTALLASKERVSLLLVGDEVVGKTALFRGWLQSQRDVPSRRPVYATSGAQLIAGMSGLGQWQERLRRVLDAAELLDAVLYFESMGDLFADRPDGHVDIAAALRPWAEESRVRLLGEVRTAAVDLYEARHASFISALQRITLAPQGAADSLRVLQSRVEHAERREPLRPNLEVSAVEPLVDLVDRYHPYSAHPGKAVRFFEQLRASCETSDEGGGVAGRRLGVGDLYRTFSLQSGIPLFLLRQDLPLHYDEVERALRRHLIGQQAAVRLVAETICVIKARLQPPEKPLASFLFAGPTGVGKTELARALASYLFGAEERLTRFDMSEYMDAAAAERLIRGNARAEGQLTRKIRQTPFCVLLLDEIEKAHPAVFDLLLQVLGEGRLTDAGGRLATFNNAIVIMTSNLGAAHRRPAPGLLDDATAAPRRVRTQIERAFRPEFINRIDRIVDFTPLSAQETEQIAHLALARIRARRGIAERQLGLELSAAALAELARRGTSVEYGARQLRRHLEDDLVAPLSRLLAEQAEAAAGSMVQVQLATEEPLPTPATSATLETKGLRLTLRRGRLKKRRGELRALGDIGALRREVDELLDLDRVQEVREQRDVLVAQLGGPVGGKQRKAPPSGRQEARLRRERTELTAEHHRLAELWRRAEEPRNDILALEELALGAAATREDAGPYLSEARHADQQLRQALCHLLVALRPHRNEVSLLVQELEGRPFDLWLDPLCAELNRLGWTMTAHGQGVAAGPGDDWPPTESCAWGPPRPASWLREVLAREQRPFRSVILRVRGPYAGCLLPLEAGPHCYPAEGGKVQRLLVRVLAPRLTLAPLEWETLRGHGSAELPKLRREAATRSYESVDGPLTILGGQRGLDIPLPAYWPRFEELTTSHLLHFELDDEHDVEELYRYELPEEVPPPPGAAAVEGATGGPS